eukprot:gene13297-15629_t
MVEDNREQTVKDSVETLFLFQRFDSVIVQTLEMLLNRYAPMTRGDIDVGALIHQKDGIVVPAALLECFDGAVHTCSGDTPSTPCQCQWMMELLIQSLYEVGRPADALKLVNHFYRGDLLEQRVIVDGELYRVNDTTQIRQEEHDQLVELLVFHILLRTNEIDEARQYLQDNRNLPVWKQEGFLKSLQEMVQIKYPLVWSVCESI